VAPNCRTRGRSVPYFPELRKARTIIRFRVAILIVIVVQWLVLACSS
jgi:hypothetical protein